MRKKSKTLAVWLTILGGPLGLHRLYLFGKMGLWGWLLLIGTLVGSVGLWRIRTFGVDDLLSWLFLPVLGLCLATCCLMALVYGLKETIWWNHRFNPDLPEEHAAGATRWITVLGLVTALMLGTTALLSSFAFGFQRYFEFQAETTQIQKAPGSVAPAAKQP